MDEPKQAVDSTSPIKLAGRISEYRCSRGIASFVLSANDQSRMGAVAIAASLAGISGPAIATAANVSSVDEEADYVEFMLDDNAVKGWVWRSPFKNGDDVEIAAQRNSDHYEVFAIARPSDRIIALYPHCSRGRARHIKNAFKLWIWLGFFGATLLFAALTIAALGTEALTEPGFFVSSAAFSLFFAVMFASLARKWMPFVGLAEKVFKTLGWANPSNIDLVKSSNEQRKETDPPEFGTFYFRY